MSPVVVSAIFAIPKSARKSAVVLSEQDVRGLHVAVEDARGVRGVQRVGQLPDPRRREAERRGRAAQAVAQRPAREVRHDEERHPVLLAEVVDRQDVRMLEGRDDARLAQEALDEVRILRVRGVDHLDGDRPRELHVRGAPHVGHSAPPENRIEAIAPERAARQVRHEVLRSRVVIVRGVYARRPRRTRP